MRETILKTTLGRLKSGNKVNLERTLKLGSRFHGHFVTGHIDAVGVVKNKLSKKNYVELRLKVKKDLVKYLVPKGSICLDGVSLTVGGVRGDQCSVYLIPFTCKGTTLGALKKNDAVNVETDILAKYLLSKSKR